MENLISNVLAKTENKTQKKAILIAVHFGKFPAWINLTFETFLRNQDFDLLVVTDQSIDKLFTYSNIQFCHYYLDAFSNLAAQKTGTQIKLKRGYKVCDLRPAFGVIFDRYIEGYEYWGHIDIDTFGVICHQRSMSLFPRNMMLFVEHLIT